MADPDPPATPIDIDAILPEIYRTLHAMAARMWQDRRPGATLQPTALVHEVYLRLAHDPARTWVDRAHVVATAARAMRQVLADHARRYATAKRRGERAQVTLSALGAGDDPSDLLAVDGALSELEALDARRAQVFVLRALGGLTVDEIAEVTGVSDRTVKSDWRIARGWLAARLASTPEAPPDPEAP